MQLNHIILMLVRSIKLLFSLIMDNKKATKSGFFLLSKINLKNHLILLTSIKIKLFNCIYIFDNYGRPETFI